MGYSDATGGIPHVGGDVDFSMGIMGSDWGGMGGLAMGDSTGMTPMSEGAWNNMLESMNMGWDSVGPSHAEPSVQGNFASDK